MEQQKTARSNLYIMIAAGLLAIWGLVAVGIVIGRDISIPTQTVRAQASGSIFVVGKSAPTRATLISIDGTATSLALGRKATVVLAMATWCKYCGYMDKWVLPSLAKDSGVKVDAIDVSPVGGVANPGPKFPEFSGADGMGSTDLSESGMVKGLREYVLEYGIGNRGIDFYVATGQTRQQWHITALPTVIVLDSRGVVTLQHPGAMTLSELAAAIYGALRKH